MAERHGAHAKTNGQGTASLASRLSFVEALLASDTLVEAAQLGVDWLVRQAGIREIVVSLVDLERAAGARLVGAASFGVELGAIASLSIDLEERDLVLVQALSSPRPTVVTQHVLDELQLGFA